VPGPLPEPRPSQQPAQPRRTWIEQPCPELLPLPDSVLHPSRWKLLVRGGFRYDENIRMLAGRTSLLPLIRASRATREFGLRLLIIGDNMGSLLSFDRGRCSDWGYLLLCRRQAARTIATGLRPHWRYVETDRNPTDWDSRAVERGELQRHQIQHFSTIPSSPEGHRQARGRQHLHTDLPGRPWTGVVHLRCEVGAGPRLCSSSGHSGRRTLRALSVLQPAGAELAPGT